MPALNRAFDHFWANDAGPGGVGLQDRYAAAWQQVAARFASAPHVLGYDLFNEPWPGSVFASCASPIGCPAFDAAQLTSFSDRVIAAIRAVDPTSLAFYEPLLTFDFGAQTAHGDTGDPHAGFSFHDYCLPGAFGGPTGGSCQTLEDLVYQNAELQSQRTGDALLQTEFGATDDLATIERIVAASDAHMVGWNYWHYCGCDDPTTQGASSQAIVNDAAQPPTGSNVREAKLAVLSRPYPQAVAGTPQSYSFDPASKRFRLTYSTARGGGGPRFMPIAAGGGQVDPSSPQTEVFIPEIHYPRGYDVETRGAAVASPPGARTLRLIACPGATSVSLTVVPPGQGSGKSPDCTTSAAVAGGKRSCKRLRAKLRKARAHHRRKRAKKLARRLKHCRARHRAP